MSSFPRSRQGRVPRTEPLVAPLSSRRGNTFGTIRPTVLLLARSLLVPLASAAPLSLFQRNVNSFAEDDDGPPKSAGDPDLYLYLGIAVALVLLGGVFAGLTIALMGQDETYLQVIATSGEGKEKRHAQKVLNLLQKGKHWVLVTLLLGNVITNETLPIVLDRSLGGGWPAVLGSTVLIVIFGEIAPQSVCVRYGLGIGAVMAPFVLILMFLLGPIAWPTAKLLDWLLGEDHGTMYKKAGLKTLVQLHKSLGSAAGERLMEDEVTIINSVLDLKDKPIGNIMTPIKDVFIMSADTVLDERMMDTILSQGYSRIPIYAPDNQRNFIGMLLVKMLITYDPEDAKRVREFSLATLPETAPNTSCLDIINFFQEGKSHMVLVSDSPGSDHGALGVVTLEDVIEELIGEEIIDESDVFMDVHKAIRRMAPAPLQRYQRKASMDPIMVDQADADAKEDEPLLGNGDVDDRKTTQAGALGGGSTFLRRKSSAASEGVRATSRPGLSSARNNTTFRNLGPSNAASKPRATKYTSVKIKPGVGTIPENQATTRGIEEDGPLKKQRSQSLEPETPRPTAIRTQTDTSERSALRSAGRDASGGAAALRAGYGTISTSPNGSITRAGPTSGGDGDQGMSAREATRVAEEKAAEPASPSRRNGNDTLHMPPAIVVGSVGDAEEEDGDKLGAMPPAIERSRSKGGKGVRSGSITETEVEFEGMKKVVLDISEDSEEEGGASTGHADDYDSDHHEEGQNGTNGGTHSNDGKKGRRKRGGKKKHHGHGHGGR